MEARTRHLQEERRGEQVLRLMAGGLTVGMMGWFMPQLLGVGYKHVGEVLNGRMALRLMILLLVLKLLAVATSYASGNAGGIFGPSLFLGAMLGGIVGNVAHSLFPTYVATPGASYRSRFISAAHRDCSSRLPPAEPETHAFTITFCLSGRLARRPRCRLNPSFHLRLSAGVRQAAVAFLPHKAS